MKKPLAHTKCTVKLRKSEYHENGISLWRVILYSKLLVASPHE